MKIIMSLLFVLPISAMGQNIAKYEHAMKKFQQFYNAGQGDSINALFGSDYDEMKMLAPLWTNKKNATYLAKYGRLKSFNFIGIDSLDPEKVYVFKTIFRKAGSNTSSLTLDKDYKLSTFRFITSSEGITELLNKQR